MREITSNKDDNVYEFLNSYLVVAVESKNYTDSTHDKIIGYSKSGSTLSEPEKLRNNIVLSFLFQKFSLYKFVLRHFITAPG